MPDTQTAPVARGQTYHGASGTINTSDYGESVALEGFVHTFKDTNPSDRTSPRSHRDVVAVLVRNVSGITLIKGRIVTFASGYWGKRVDGYSKVTNPNNIAGVVDDHLGNGGVRNGDLFWVIIKGPCLVYTSVTALPAVIAAGQLAYAMTAAASTAKTTGGTNADDAGCVLGTAVATDVGDDYIANNIGRCLSAATTANTNTAILCSLDVRI